MALLPDISGVCSVTGTLPITSTPTSSASTNTLMSVNRAALMIPSGLRLAEQSEHAVIRDAAAVRDEHCRLQLVLDVQRQLAVGAQQLERRGDVAGVRRGRRARDLGGEVAGTDQEHPVRGDDPAVRRAAFDVPAQRTCREV